MLQSADDRRRSYIQMLETAIDIVAKSNDVPCACFVQIFWSSQQVTRIKQMEKGTPLLPLVGMFEVMTTELSSMVLNGNEEGLAG